jgi:hypothetical protein
MVPRPEAILALKKLISETVARTNPLQFEAKHFSIANSKAG